MQIEEEFIRWNFAQMFLIFIQYQEGGHRSDRLRRPRSPQPTSLRGSQCRSGNQVVKEFIRWNFAKIHYRSKVGYTENRVDVGLG